MGGRGCLLASGVEVGKTARLEKPHLRIVDPDPGLVAAVARFDEAAVGLFIERYDGIICASVVQGAYFFPDPRDVEELQNDVRRTVIERIHTWKRAKGRFSTWFYGIARHIVNSFLRDRANGLESGRYGDEVGPGDLLIEEPERMSEIDQEDEVVAIDPFDPPDDSSTSDRSRTTPLSPLLKAFFEVSDELSATERLVLEHVLNGAPHQELAERLGITEDAAKVRVSRLKQRIRESILKRVETT